MTKLIKRQAYRICNRNDSWIPKITLIDTHKKEIKHGIIHLILSFHMSFYLWLQKYFLFCISIIIQIEETV